ncbi:hypothetical protein CPB86DRAFT_682819, partial [Serendipita vermifera]
ITCIDVYGTATSPYSPSTIIGIPAASTIPNDVGSLQYSPPEEWKSSNSVHNCTLNNSVRVTSTLNSKVSFNYTGPSIRVHTVTSPKGGVFSVFVDGFNTSSQIDTFGGEDSSLPRCYPVQFPPFVRPPPDLATRTRHTITLIYTGASPKAPPGTNVSQLEFDSFSIPEF